MSVTIPLVDYPGQVNGARALLIDAKDANDDADPSISAGYIDVSGRDSVRLEVAVGGTTAGWTLTPCYANGDDATYHHGDPIQVSTADDAAPVFVIPSFGATKFHLKCDGSYGTTPTLSVYATPYGG